MRVGAVSMFVYNDVMKRATVSNMGSPLMKFAGHKDRRPD